MHPAVAAAQAHVAVLGGGLERHDDAERSGGPVGDVEQLDDPGAGRALLVAVGRGSGDAATDHVQVGEPRDRAP
ncbi:hypothetical protein [Frigoribacterium sp. PhB118]|uniref:hypothetical protein n=1 Tax=Frigoribacterium sp. PhB118 TaxID=2485175 RepID=UPI000F47E66E|nr:hypothetical protein [Frigoribacterium sp. PhB118]